MSDFTLYYRYDTCAFGSYVVLEETGATYDVVHVEAGDAGFLGVNPRGKVPVLDTGNHRLRETVAILSYLAERYPETRLLPADALAKADCISLTAWMASELHINFRRVVKPFVFAESESAQAEVKVLGRERYIDNLAELDGLIGRSGGWVANGTYSICDPYALHFIDWALWIDIDVARWDNISKWVARVMARPAVRAAAEAAKRQRLLQFVA